MTTDATTARAWLTGHLDAGIEGVVAKRLNQPYRLHSSWRKVRGRTSAKAIVGGVLGPIYAPIALVLGRPDVHGRLRVVGRTGPIPRHMRTEVGALMHPAGAMHDVRHTYATLALTFGIEPKIVSDRVGHSNPGVTFQIYTHPSVGADRGAAELLGQMIQQAIRGDDLGPTDPEGSGAADEAC